jgi:hypothetical protein
MITKLCVQTSKPSKLRRLAFLPRIGLIVDVGGRQFTYRQAPLAETLLNLAHRGFSMKNLMEIGFQQFREIELPKFRKEG